MEINVSKKDRFNGMNSASKAEDFINAPFVIKGLFTFEDDVLNKETGEINTATLVCIITDEGKAISSPSKTLVDSVSKLVEAYGEDEVIGVEAMITANKSNANRTFYRLELV